MAAINSKTKARSDEELTGSSDDDDGPPASGVKGKANSKMRDMKKKLAANPKGAKFLEGFNRFFGIAKMPKKKSKKEKKI
jgi:hypothetical protein